MDMRQLTHVSGLVFNQAQMIDPAAAEVIAGAVIRARSNRGETLKQEARELGLYAGDDDRGPNDFYMLPNGIGVIPIFGTLVHRHDWMTAISGMTSYTRIRDMAAAALRDDSVREILLHIDSPGGMVKGCFDTVDFLAEARERKPITAFADGQMTSAAYALGSAATRIISSDTSNIGSIGVLMMHVDRSAFLRDRGINVTYIKSGEDKDLGAENKPLSDEDRAKLQAHVDSVAERFFARVNANRQGLSVDTVRGLEAGVFLGAQAQEIGLIDEINSYQDTLSALTEQPYGSWHRAGAATMQADTPEGETEMTDEDRNTLALLVNLHASATVPEIIERIKSTHKERDTAVAWRNTILTTLGLAADISDEKAIERVEGLKSLAVSQEDHDALKTELQDLRAEVMIDKAIKEDRKLLPAERDAWLKDAKEDYDGTKAKLEARPQVIPSGGLPPGPGPEAVSTGETALLTIREKATAYMQEQHAKGNKISRMEATVAVTRGGKGV